MTTVDSWWQAFSVADGCARVELLDYVVACSDVLLMRDAFGFAVFAEAQERGNAKAPVALVGRGHDNNDPVVSPQSGDLMRTISLTMADSG